MFRYNTVGQMLAYAFEQMLIQSLQFGFCSGCQPQIFSGGQQSGHANHIIDGSAQAITKRGNDQTGTFAVTQRQVSREDNLRGNRNQSGSQKGSQSQK